MARPFDHHLHAAPPGDLGQFAQGLQLGELRRVVGVGDAARPQAVAEAEGDVVGPHDLADVLEVVMEEALPVVGQAPLGHDRAAARDDAGHPPTAEGEKRQREVARIAMLGAKEMMTILKTGFAFVASSR